MTNIVITGSSRGIGRGMALEFVQRGHNVVISGRNPDDIRRAVEELSATGSGHASGLSCDVSSKAQVQALWDHATGRFGRVDIWINNAGRAISHLAVRDTGEALVNVMVDSNLKGMIFGSQVALAGFAMLGGGALYNMLGGTTGGGRLSPNMGIYSATKAADRQLTRYLVAENTDPNIIIGSISPGVLISDNWLAEQKHLPPAEWQKVRPFMNILCDHVDTATPWLVEQVLTNRRPGKLISWMTTPKLLGRMGAAYLLGRRRDVFSRYGI